MGGDRAEIWEDPLVNMLVRNLNWWYHAGENREGVQGGHLNLLSFFLNPHGFLLTHLHTVCMEYDERLPTLFAPPG